ncbi:MAG: ion transporter [Gemmatimonadota bacterium]|jgi:voltage-gated potassium channel
MASGGAGPHPEPDRSGRGVKERLYEIIFESDTPEGKAFDVALIVAILASVVVVMVDSIPSITGDLRQAMWIAEWAFTLAFTVEYLLRLWVVRRPSRYARSFFGIVDLLAILPTYLALIIPGAQYLLAIRVLRVLRIFRVLRLAHFVGEANMIRSAVLASRHKIGIFLFAVVTAVTVLGSLLYIIEGPASGFDSIPRATYWAIVTLTTVGYGDIAPQTPLGQGVAALIMLLGYGMIAVPTGIFTVEMGRAADAGGPNQAAAAGEPAGPAEASSRRSCASCGHTEPDPDAHYCRYCGEGLES